MIEEVSEDMILNTTSSQNENSQLIVEEDEEGSDLSGELDLIEVYMR